VVALSRIPSRSAFTSSDFERARMLADFGSIVIRNLQLAMEAAEKSTIDKETSISEDIQKMFLPKKLPDMEKMSFGAFSSPARGVHSDYYDIIHNKQGSAVLVISDVAGKGIHSSLLMVMIRTLLHLTTITTKNIGTVLTWVNRGITGKIEMDHFATLALAEVDLETGQIQYSSAAHQNALIVRKKTSTSEMLEMESVPIGVDRKTEYTATNLQLEPGDTFVMYTDGILEAMNIQGKQYGKKRLGDVILRNAGQTAKDLAVTVRSDVQDFIGQARQHDDQSILIMRLKA
jgi:sigma-B regulation protein RsbU (phosphoserine phosphatase)